MQFNSALAEYEESGNKDEPFFAEDVVITDFPDLTHSKTDEYADKVSI